MKRWISDWRHALIALGFGALALFAAIFVPESRWTKLGLLFERVVEEPAGFVAFIALIGGAITTLRGAWMRTPPPTALLLAALVLPVLTGCAPTTLQLHARVFAFASVTLEASHASMVTACTAIRDDCAGDAACLEHGRASCTDVAVAQDTARDAVDLYGRVIVAAQVAGGDAEILPQLLVALSLAARGWAALGRAYGAVVGHELPGLPPWASTLLAAVAGGAS